MSKNKRLDEYKRKSNNIIKTIKLIGVFIFVLGLLISIVQYQIQRGKKENYLSQEEQEYSINLEENEIVDANELNLEIKINDFKEQNVYKIIIELQQEVVYNNNLTNQINNIKLNLSNEGKNEIKINIYNDEKEYNKSINIYYIKPYENEFLDTLSNKGVQVHYRSNTSWEDYKKSIPLIKMLGCKNIRADIFYSGVVKRNGTFNFEYYDRWIKEASDNGINILLELNGLYFGEGTSTKADSDEKKEKIAIFFRELYERYNQIKKYEILNEPNFEYISDQDLKNYSDIVKVAKENAKGKKIEIISGGLAYLDKNSSKQISIFDFLDKLTLNNGYKYSDGYSYHPYDGSSTNKQNPNFYENLQKIKRKLNEYGGFLKNAITEYGIAIYGNNTVEVQAEKIVQQTVLTDSYNIDIANIYNFWDTKNDGSTANYGIIYNNYTPKPSYYAMKNYYQNTNGAEYIGSLNITNGLEAHTYDKDGHPLIIAWSNNTDNTYNFTLNQMTAKDIYGKEITPDSNGQIQITTSPVYLYNVPTNYFYQAISNTATTKYNEFTENYADQISKVQGLQQTINTLNQRMKDLSSTSNLDETTSINLMKQHFNLGNTLIQAYKSGTLQIEYVKLSSMLDALNDIGNSFEDLVTVSAKTRNANISETLNTINKADNLINDNDIEMIYPSKILQFSQDFYDKASYINGLEEENDIKTGLIVSKNLHSKLLSDWATQFANLYIDTYIKNNPVTIDYSETNPTNQNVTATLRTNAQITINNNSNSKVYTFTQNGTFTFDYTIKGQTFQQTATVNNIDKTAPTIEGVENDRLYLSEVTPKASDTNLKEVLLYKDNNQVQNYQQNTKITEDGHYKLVAEDLAGNQTSVEFDISRNPAIIDYSEVNLTNQDVVATVNSNFDVNVKNNSNQKSYTFKENGEFTFELNIKGAELQLTAKVDNIDKTPPTITDVEDKKQYMDKVTPKISDDNLNEVKLYFDSEEVQGYTPNSEITGEGFYKLVAKDLAGNETSVEFTIIENPDEKYQIKDGNILNIKNNTNQDIFRKKLKMSGEYSIYRNDTLISDNDKIATGDKLRKSTGEEYTLIVSGDINNDGDVNIKDIVMLRKYLLERNNLDENSLLAADCNLDGKDISIKDLIRMRLIALERDVN